jgi:sugar phosphate isomerase/epimerase
MAAAGLRLGLDTFSLRAQNWSPFEQLDYCARLGLQVVHFSEIRFLGSLDAEHLHHVRAHADVLGLDVEIGMRSIAPSSTTFDAAAGSATSQLSAMIEAARIIRSPIVRCFVGRYVDRSRPGGIDALIDESVDVLKSVRSQAIDAGIRIAVENHAGDLQSRELAALVERAGTDYVGVCLDSGNALWALESPHCALRTLAPYVLTSHMRDGVVWRTKTGAAVLWTRMGTGRVDMCRYLKAFTRACPRAAVTLEHIILPEPRLLDFGVPPFWSAYPDMRAIDLIDFLEIAAEDPDAVAPPRAPSAADDLDAIDASLAWMRDCLS